MRQCITVILVLWMAVATAFTALPALDDDDVSTPPDIVSTSAVPDDAEDVTDDPAPADVVHPESGEGVETNIPQQQRLTLSRCNLRRLDDACFPPRHSPPRILDASRNALTDAGASTVAAASVLASLRALDLSSNAVVAVSSRWTRGTPLLRTLDLSANNVSSVEAGALAPLAHLRWLNVSANRLAQPPFSELPATLRTLDLSRNGISALRPGAASHLRALRSLYLADNRLPELRAAWFQGLVSLQFLDLSGNDVRALDSVVFAVLGALTELRLRANRIEILAPGCFEGLANLKTLDLSENVMVSLEAEAFVPLGELWTLSLRENRLDSICESCFEGLTSAEELDLSGNRLISLENATFASLVSMKRLNLSGNRMESLGEGCWTGLESLAHLDLSRNALSLLENGSFSALGPTLLSLDVSRNRVSALGEDAFAGLARLQRLDLSLNALRGVWPGALAPLAGLTELRVAGNPLLPTQRLLPASRRLQRVDASRTRLRQVPAALTRSVRALALSGCAVAAVRRGDLDSYPLLRTLTLSDNRVADVEEDAMGRLENLVELRLDGNRLVTVPRSLPASLHLLNLQRNRITVLHVGDLQDLPKLRELSLRDCALTSIEPGAFAQLETLEDLDLSANPILSLPPDALAGPPRLRILHLSHLSRLRPAPSDTAGSGVGLFPVGAPERLEVLSLNGSPLLAQQLLGDAAALAAFRDMRELDLREAKLTSLRADLFGYLPRLSALRLADNPWSCARADEVLWLARWMRRQDEAAMKDLKAASCEQPAAFKGRLIIELTTAEFRGEGGTASPEAEGVEDTTPTCPALIALCQELLQENTTTPSPTTISSTIPLHTFSDHQTPAITKLRPVPSTFPPPLVHIIPSEGKQTKHVTKDQNNTFKKKVVTLNATKTAAFISTKQLLNITVLHSVTIPPYPQATSVRLSSTPRTRSSSRVHITLNTTTPVQTTILTKSIITASTKQSTSHTTDSPTSSRFSSPSSSTRHIVAPTARTKYTSISVSRTHQPTIHPSITSRRVPFTPHPPSPRSETHSPPPPKNISRAKPFDTIMRDKSSAETMNNNVTRLDIPKRDSAKEESSSAPVMLQDQPQAEAVLNPAQTVGSFIDETRRKLKQEHDLRRLSPLQISQSDDVTKISSMSYATKILSDVSKTDSDASSRSSSSTISSTSSSGTTTASSAAEAWRSGESLLLENTTALAQPRAAAADGANLPVSGGSSGGGSGSSTSAFAYDSHPGMFVLVAVGVAVAAALATALSHCAKRHRRRRSAAVEYSRQQDIEVRSMSSVGGPDLW